MSRIHKRGRLAATNETWPIGADVVCPHCGCQWQTESKDAFNGERRSLRIFTICPEPNCGQQALIPLPKRSFARELVNESIPEYTE